jgi:hypothetical protein
MESADVRGIGLAPVDRWPREGGPPGLARADGRLILASPGTVADPSGQDAAGRYARVPSPGQKTGPGPTSARLPARAGVPMTRSSQAGGAR